MKTLVKQLGPSLLFLSILLLGIEGLVRMGWLSDYLVPSPTQIIGVYLRDGGVLGQAALSTAISSVMGMLLCVLACSGLWSLLFFNPWLGRAILPICTFFQTVPLVAVAPILVIYLGYGRPSVVAASFIVCFFPLLSALLHADSTVDPTLVEMFESYRASRRRMFTRLVVPWVLPHAYAALRITCGLAVVGSIVGELTGGGGLGEWIETARSQQRMDQVFAGVLWSTLIGFGLTQAVSRLGSWAQSGREAQGVEEGPAHENRQERQT